MLQSTGHICTNNDSALLPTAELDCWSCLILICGERSVSRDTKSNKFFPVHFQIFVLTTHTRTHACTHTHRHKHTHTHTHMLSLSHTRTHKHANTHTHTHTHPHTHTHTHTHTRGPRTTHWQHSRFSLQGAARVYSRCRRLWVQLAHNQHCKRRRQRPH